MDKMNLILMIHTKYYHFNMVINIKVVSELFYSFLVPSLQNLVCSLYLHISSQTSHM